MQAPRRDFNMLDFPESDPGNGRPIAISRRHMIDGVLPETGKLSMQTGRSLTYDEDENNTWDCGGERPLLQRKISGSVVHPDPRQFKNV